MEWERRDYCLLLIKRRTTYITINIMRSSYSFVIVYFLQEAYNEKTMEAVFSLSPVFVYST